MNLDEEWMKEYKGYVDKMWKVEKELEMGKDEEGERIKDKMRKIVKILMDKEV
jgi:syntaxin-binding protein 1